MKKLLLVGVCTLLAACGSTYKVKPATGEETGGIHYYLPKNQVRVTVPVTQTKTKQGRFHAEIANCFELADQRKPDTTGTSYKLGAPTYTLLAVRDDNHRYFVNLEKPANPFVTRTGEFNLNQSQVLTSAKAGATDYTVDWAIDLAETAVSLATAAGGTITLSNGKQCSGLASKTITELNRIRAMKIDLAANHRTSISEEIYKQKKADLSGAEKTLLGYFYGEKVVSKYDLNITVEPALTWETAVDVCMFDENMKALETIEQLAKHHFRVLSDGCTTTATGLILSVIPNHQSGDDQTNESGLYYRVPGEALFKLAWLETKVVVPASGIAITKVDTQTLGQQNLAIAQFGVTRSLPRKFGLFKSEVSEFTLDPLTGGIQKLAVNGEGLGKTQASALNDIVSKSQTDKELAKLTRERDILKLKNEIDELRNPVEE